jgi:hypothetical protein
MSVQDLAETLRKIEFESMIEEVPGTLNWGDITERHKYIQDADYMAPIVLIDENGNRNIDAEYYLKNNGFNIICLENDGFGWLVGGILTEKGIIAYG